jgi:YidC/Oxa1 family membrane protein insertase
MALYETFQNYGVSIILFALIIKVILLPFQMKSKRSMMQTQRLQPKLKELEKKHAGNKTKYNEEVAKLYREEGINPASGCIWSLIPFPILIALFYAIRQPLTTMMGVAKTALEEGGVLLAKLTETGFDPGKANKAYLEIGQAEWINAHWDKFDGIVDKLRQIDFHFLGIDLSAQPQWKFLWTTDWKDAAIWGPGLILFMIPIVSAGLTYIQSRVSAKMTPTPADAPGGGSMKSMMLMMPLLSLYFAFIMPAALGVYWAVGSVLALAQDVWLTKRYNRIMAVEDVEKNKKREELERKREETERRRAEGAAEANPNTSKRRQQLTEKQEKQVKSAEWEKKNNPEKEKEKGGEPSRAGTRRYARGRAYDPDRFEDSGREEDETEPELAELAEEAEPEPEETTEAEEMTENEQDD